MKMLYPGQRAIRLLAFLLLAVLAVGLAPAFGQAAGDIEKLIAQLGDDKRAVRLDAEKKLAEIGEKALEQLRKAAKGHPDADVRLRAVVIIGQIERKASGPARNFAGHTGAVRGVALSRDGKYLLSGSMDNTLRLWGLETGKELRTFKGHGSWVWSVAFTPDDKQVLSTGSMDQTTRLWDAETAKEVRKYPGSRGRVYGAAFSPNGKMVATGSGDGDPNVRLYETDSGKLLKTMPGHGGWIWRVQFSPNGKRLVSAGMQDATARVWDVDGGKAVSTISCPGWVVGVAFVDDKRVLTSSRDGLVQMWDAETAKPIQKYSEFGGPVEALAVLPDGKRALAAAKSTVALFDLETGKVLRRFEGHTDTVHTLAVSADGKRAVSGGSDNTIKLWALPAR